MVPSSRRGRGFRLPRARRITQGGEIQALFRRGKRSKTASMDVFASASPAGFSRIALVVPRHRMSAAARNRVKRRLREIARMLILPRLDDAGDPTDVLIRARREAYETGFAGLRDEILTWLDSRWPLEPRSP